MTITFENFDSREFEDRYHYTGPLGCTCSPEGTQFCLWAPTAEKIVLNLYREGSGGEILRREELIPGERGVWTYGTGENLDGFYYNYEVTVEGTSRLTGDPYARACGVNGVRSMVLDPARTNPEGWEMDHAPALSRENVIYEVHVKDFSWDSSSGIDPQKRGRYLGLCQSGTTLNGDGIHPTGMDYLKALGVTHVQLMPVYDYGSVDEADSKDAFNWGYDPMYYNVPEGSYSSDPFHGEVRIRELKETIRTLHANGFRVIMDVVYNHTYRLDSALNRVVPGYYYRFRPDGSPSNGSGCGNDTASERSMCGRFILDSVLYWAEEYHFDGFRFDLMGLLPVDLMNRIRTALDDRFGAGEKLLFGEPWRAAETFAAEGTVLADKEHLHLLHPGVGAFCDTTRDAVKGKLMNENDRGFVNGGTYCLELFEGCLRGWAGVRGEYSVNNPMQTIGYLSCHDDWTLWDRLINTMEGKPAYTGSDQEAMRANRLAIAILAGCQGNLFLLSGEEFARTKEGIKNSYASSIQINRLDWNRAWKNEELKKYYQGLFALRKQLPGLCDKSVDAARWIRSVSEASEGCVIVRLENPRGESRWREILSIYHMGEETCQVGLPEGRWQLLADGTDSFGWKQEHWMEGSVQAEPLAAMILGRS